ncbi:MAG TPA: hypothetical protein VFE58_10730 [Tepidisphaeraceae bacterium]|jgi:hypothetical protein|nr:hypothetical protein [Tepidisphaeraceae bacterium]
MADGSGQLELEDWLRLRICPGCDYSLETLPAEGVCPECGRAYGQEFVVLAGEGRGKFEGETGRGRKGLAWNGVSLAILLWLVIQGRWVGGNVSTAGYVIVGMIGLGLGLYGWLFSARELRMQVWMSEEGIGQWLSTVEGRRAAWLKKRLGLLFIPIFLMLTPIRGWVGIIFYGLIGMWIVVEAGKWLMGREMLKDGDRPALWAWEDVDGVKVQETSNGKMRLRCRGLMRWGWIVLSKGWVIDVEVECPKELVADVGEKIRSWWIVKQKH